MVLSHARELVWKWRCKLRPYRELDINVPLPEVEIPSDEKKNPSPKEPAASPDKGPSFGADASVKTFFEGPKSQPGLYDWVDYPPRQLSKAAVRVHDRVAIKIYKVKDKTKPAISGCAPLKYYQIEVQNLLLIAALTPIVKKENMILAANCPAVFDCPSRALWFGQDEIKATYEALEDSSTLRNPLQLLIRVLDDMFAELKVKQKQIKSTGLVDFKTAWTLFPKGSSVYSYSINSEVLIKVESTTMMGAKMLIEGKALTFNGREYVWEDRVLPLPYFSGYKPVTELPHCPLEWLPDAAKIKARCIARGKKLLDFQGIRYCCYNGLGIQTCRGQAKRHNVEGRVLIDVVGYNRFLLSQGSRETEDPETARNRVIKLGGGYDSSEDEEKEEEKEEEKPKTNPNRTLTAAEQQKNKDAMLCREEDLAFATNLVEGFALRNKEWLLFYIEDIEPMVWNEKAFTHLVYDAGQKDLVLSFVENHVSNANYEDGSAAMAVEDVIVGKGQGLITLLSGPPGTGKTLTAEAVADRAKRPLYHLHAEDLGISAANLGENLKRVFDMAIHWGAVVLLDEADVFMAERNPNDIHRNELVSIFLRELEYFRGILFLTTNLYHTIDTAFRSRVNLHLVFPALSRESRASVWRNFIQRLPPTTAKKDEHSEESVTEVEEEENLEDTNAPLSTERPIDDDDIKELSLWQLNGREIKNSVKMAHSWCTNKGYLLTLDRAQSGIKVTAPNAAKEGDVDPDLYD
ncbi:unnamed protein product [Clonostachys chloroleuca]|uniref:AAA+ ATPase domain-containing protein n=1 Tax=Clonostachys chloroleuca TaxID=1926264 RepID=A0AA35PY08_9HYPO|nr:unnamed protein product [Clonostachys chloroleuca]